MWSMQKTRQLVAMTNFFQKKCSSISYYKCIFSQSWMLVLFWCVFWKADDAYLTGKCTPDPCLYVCWTHGFLLSVYLFVGGWFVFLFVFFMTFMTSLLSCIHFFALYWALNTYLNIFDWKLLILSLHMFIILRVKTLFFSSNIHALFDLELTFQ